MNMSLRQNFEDLGLSQSAISLLASANPASGALLQGSYEEVANEDYSYDYRNTFRIQNGNVFLPLSFYQSFHSQNPPGYEGISQNTLGEVIYKAGHQVTGIYQLNNLSKVVVKYQMDKEDEVDIFDYVICTLPYSVLRTIEVKPYFSNMKMQAIFELNYIDAMKSLFLCNRRFWEENANYGNILGGISFTDLPIQSIIYPSDHNFCQNTFDCSPEEPGVLTASYNLEQNSIRLGGMEYNARYEVVKQNVEEVHGLPRGFLNSYIERHRTVHWNDEPLYRGALAYNLPGQKRLFAYEMKQPEYNERLYFAGEHLSNKHGWIQGALSSGKDAANQIATHYVI
jgi:monoamine oxidase